MKSHRLARVSEVVREVAATTVLFDLKDPRVKNVTVTRAEVSPDLQHAKVFVSVMGSDKEQQLTMHGLRAAAGFVQSKLAKQLTTRFVPHVIFVLDEGVKKSVEIGRMIAEEMAKLPPDPAAGGDSADKDEDTDDAPAAGDPADTPGGAAAGPAPSPPRAGPADGPADR